MANKGSSGGASAGAIRAGAAFVEIFVKDGALQRGLDAAASRVKAFGAKVSGVGLGIFGAGTAALAPVTAAVGQMLDHFGDMKDAADRLNTTTETISALGYAAEQSGASFEDLEAASKELMKTVAEEGREFGALDDEFVKVADAFEAIEDPAQRTKFLLDVLGKAGLKMAPLLAGGAEGVRELLERAGRVGSVIDSDQAAKAEAAGDALNDVWLTLKNTLMVAAAEAVIPFAGSFQNLVEQIVDAGGAARAWLKENGAIVAAGIAAVAGVTALGAALVALGVSISAAGTALSAFAAILGVVTSPLGILVGLVGGLTAAFLTLTPEGRAFADEVAGYWTDSLHTFTEAWGGMAKALAGGDLALAGRIALAALEVEWLRFVAVAKNVWREFVDFFADGWDQGIGLMTQAVTKFIADLKRQFGGAIRDIGNAMATLAEKTGDLHPIKAATFRAIANASAADLERAGEGVLSAAFDKADERRADRARAAAADQAAIAAARAELAGMIAQAEALQKGPTTQPPKSRTPADLPTMMAEAMKSVPVGVLSTGGYGAQIFGTQAVEPMVKELKKNNGLLKEIRDEAKKPDKPFTFKP